MTTSKCGSCGGILVERGPRSALVCEDCGRVNNDNQVDEQADTPIQKSDSETHEVQQRSKHWTESVEVTDSTEEQLVDILSYVDEVGCDLDAGAGLQDRTAELMIKAWKNRLLVGRSKEVVTGACWYLACREHGEPRPIGVVADAINVSSSELHSTRRKATEELELSLGVVRPCEYLTYLRSQLNLTAEITAEAKELLNEVDVTGNPAGIAAGGVYLAANNRNQAVTMKEAARAVRLSKETIWQRVEDLRDQ